MLARAIRPAATSSRALSRSTSHAGPRPLLVAVSYPSTATISRHATREASRNMSSSTTTTITSTASSPSPPTPRKLVPRERVLTIFEEEEEEQTDAAGPPPDEEHIPGTTIAVLRTVADVRRWAALRPPRGPHDQGLALVPTMGALHEGHASLVREAARRGHRRLVVSIFVNPAQFGAAEDLDSYPKTWDGDCAALRALAPELEGSDEQLDLAVFAPTTSEMYPSGFPGQEVDSDGSFVTITPVGALLEGRTRPTFFRGVATVCMKLFAVVLPSRAFFGQKDVQQTVVVRRMVRDFCLPVDVAVVPTVRDPRDGLALSSRNVYLGARRRRVAPVLVTALRAAESCYLEAGALQAAEIVPAALRVVLDVLDRQSRLPPREGVVFQLDYISLADPDTMEEIEEVDPARGAILSGAIKMLPVYEAQEGEDLGHNNGPPVRLIDNLILPPR